MAVHGWPLACFREVVVYEVLPSPSGEGPVEHVLVRHGESVGNVAAMNPRLSGAQVIGVPAPDADVHLSPIGYDQAAALVRSILVVSRDAVILLSGSFWKDFPNSSFWILPRRPPSFTRYIRSDCHRPVDPGKLQRRRSFDGPGHDLTEHGGDADALPR